ncbi:MAG: SAM-dependent methyltransferase [Cyanobacteria bacterium P01_H01_bin.58]
MAMQLEEVVPFGRTLDEYIQMFNLTEGDRHKSILSVADGPASFNAEGTRLGYRIKSVDPLYVFSAHQIQQRFDAVVDKIMGQIKQTPDDWVWTYHHSLNQLRNNREKAIQLFCEDYSLGQQEDRYEVGELPALKYADDEYELCLSSHFLFLYSEHLDESFHLSSMIEMLRVCKEVRVFPLLTLMLKPSPHLQPIIEQLEARGFICTIQTVPYELQRGGNQMLKITQATD